MDFFFKVAIYPNLTLVSKRNAECEWERLYNCRVRAIIPNRTEDVDQKKMEKSTNGFT